MANSYHHSVSSAKHYGGRPEDYQEIHDWFDESKRIMPDFRHRALRHHAEGCFSAEQIFGTTITNSEGKKVPVRLIAERHIKEDLGFIPTIIDWFQGIKVEKFMTRGYMKDSEFIENFNDYDEIVESKPFEGTDLEFKELDENSVGRNVI